MRATLILRVIRYFIRQQESRHRGLKLCYLVNIPVHTFSTVNTSNSGRACTIKRVVTGITTISTIQARTRFTGRRG